MAEVSYRRHRFPLIGSLRWTPFVRQPEPVIKGEPRRFRYRLRSLWAHTRLIGLAIFSMQRRRYRAEGGRVDPVGYLREVLSPQEVGRRLAFVDKATRKP